MLVDIRLSVLLFFAIMAAASMRFLGFEKGIWAAAAITVSVLAHEAGHVVIARRYGVAVKAVGMSILGGFTVRERSKNIRHERLITFAGPLVNFALCVAFARYNDRASSFVAFANFLLAVSNLVPIGPSDGRRLFRLHSRDGIREFHARSE